MRVRLFFATALTLSVMGGTVFAEEDETADIGKLTCREVVLQTGSDRPTTIAFLHGFLLGKSGGTVINVDKMVEATESMLESCIDEPSAIAIDVLDAEMHKN